MGLRQCAKCKQLSISCKCAALAASEVDPRDRERIMQPPAPKYWVGESIGFNRKRYHDIASAVEMDGAMLIGQINLVEVRFFAESRSADDGGRAGQWNIIYWTQHDDGIPEDCVLGIPTMSPPR